MHGAGTLDLAVAELTSRTVQVCGPEDEITDIMSLMTHHRIRRVPVVDRGRLAGIISIGDVVKCRLDEMEFEVNSLKDYVRGAA